MKVRVPRGSTIRGSSMIRQSRSGMSGPHLVFEQAILDCPSRVADIDLSLLGVLVNHRAHTYQAVFRNLHVIGDAAIDAEETVFPHVAITGHHYMRRDEDVFADDRLMPDVIPAPEHHVVADPHAILQD